jgi:alpha-L-arabinofuranosidase
VFNKRSIFVTMATLVIMSTSITNVIAKVTAKATSKNVISIDPSKIVKSQKQPLIGENLNFLMSSDKKWPRKVSMKQRIKEMNLGMLRFPYGHLGDNYLFTDAPFNDGIKGLTPRVASMNTAPGTQGWTVNDKGYFTKALDFDEFMEYINELNVEPLIMVNMLGYDQKHYRDTVVTFEDLKTHAVEWVRYANITRGHKIKYWQLGNEVASHTDKETYFKHYLEVAKAMKAVDPSIHIGFGEDGRRDWIKEVLADDNIGQYIDFLSPHQYMFGRKWTESYEAWRDFSGKLTSKIDKLQHYADTSKNHKNVPLIITEYGITGGNYPENESKHIKRKVVTEFVTEIDEDKNYGNDLWKSLVFAELSLSTFKHKNVSHMVHWNTHTSWQGEFGGYHGNIENSLNNTLDNSLTPVGQVIKLINNHTFDNIISVQEKHGFVRAYATVASDTDDLAMILINKNDKPELVQFDFENYLPSVEYERWTYTGKTPEDEYPQLSLDDGSKKLVVIKSGQLQTSLAPLSLTVIQLSTK